MTQHLKQLREVGVGNHFLRNANACRDLVVREHGCAHEVQANVAGAGPVFALLHLGHQSSCQRPHGYDAGARVQVRAGEELARAHVGVHRPFYREAHAEAEQNSAQSPVLVAEVLGNQCFALVSFGRHLRLQVGGLYRQPRQFGSVRLFGSLIERNSKRQTSKDKISQQENYC